MNADAHAPGDLVGPEARRAFHDDIPVDLSALYSHMQAMSAGQGAGALEAHRIASAEIAARIKARSATLGYGLASAVAHSFLQCLEGDGPLPLIACRAHFEALRGVFAGGHEADDGPQGRHLLALLARCRTAT